MFRGEREVKQLNTNFAQKVQDVFLLRTENMNRCSRNRRNQTPKQCAISRNQAKTILFKTYELVNTKPKGDFRLYSCFRGIELNENCEIHLPSRISHCLGALRAM